MYAPKPGYKMPTDAAALLSQYDGSNGTTTDYWYGRLHKYLKSPEWEGPLWEYYGAGQRLKQVNIDAMFNLFEVQKPAEPTATSTPPDETTFSMLGSILLRFQAGELTLAKTERLILALGEV